MFQIKKLEEFGIGRPSTYASIFRVLQVCARIGIFLVLLILAEGLKAILSSEISNTPPFM